jgi:saccharopine dehydrogenase-like NADP-dependent oxidoreductase
MKKNILILGGYGKAGRQIAALLLRRKPELTIALAGRNLEKADKESARINQALGSQNVIALRLDASNKTELLEAFQWADFIVNAASTMEHTSTMVEAVLESGNDYLDTQLSSPTKLNVLFQNAEQFVANDICFVTDGGFHPGLPAALIRYSALQMDEIEKGNVYGALKINWAELGVTKGTMAEFIDEFKQYSTAVYKDRKWQEQSFTNYRSFNFGAPFGEEQCLPMYLEEMKVLTDQLPEIKETGFYLTGFNKVLDNLLLPIIFLGIKIVPRQWAWPFVRLFLWGSTFTKPPYGVKLVSECSGTRENQPVNMRIEIANSDEYLLTAAPVVACLLQLLDGSIRKPGLWFESNLVEPERFLADIQQLGIECNILHVEEPMAV